MRAVRNEYNSESFGLAMADLTVAGDWSGADVDSALEDAAARGIVHVSAKVPVQRGGELNTLLARGFRLVDTQLSYARDLGEGDSGVRPSPAVRLYAASDVAAMEEIALRSFTVDRWHSDPSLPDVLCDRYYARWVLSSARGYAREILVAVSGGECAGFLALRDDSGACRIDLTAVAERYRGRGLYRLLVSQSLRWAAVEGYGRMVATTQIGNLGSRVTWVRLGFVPTGGCYVLHKVIGDPHGDKSPDDYHPHAPQPLPC